MQPFNDDPITVLIILDHAHVTGGQAKVAFDSAIGLKAQGHRPIIFAAAGPISPDLVQAEIEVVCLEQSDDSAGANVDVVAVRGFDDDGLRGLVAV